MTTSATATTPSEILHHTAAFISETISSTELRRRLLSVLRRKTTLSTADDKTLNLVADTVENAISTATPPVRSSSLRLAEKLLHALPGSSFSSLLLSLAYGLWRRPIDAALCLLDVFRLDPLSARSEISPTLFEELFLVHLLPVFHCFNEQRIVILSNSMSRNDIDHIDDYSICHDPVVAIPSAKSLSKMSDEQARELKELEREYEEVLDENCRVLAEYLKEVLENINQDDHDQNRMIDPPPLMLKNSAGKFEVFDGRDELEEDGDQQFRMRSTRDTGISINRRYNVICLYIFLQFHHEW